MVVIAAKGARVWLAAALISLGAAIPVRAQTPRAGSVRIKLGASSTVVLFGQLNANDARAAILTWADALSHVTPVSFETLPDVLLTPQQILQGLRNGEVDAFTATTPEYFQVAAWADPGLVLVNDPAQMGQEEYVLLVHADSGIREVRELRGRRLVYLGGPVMSLAADWLETLLADRGLPPPETFFGQMSVQGKVSRAILPVFFRQSDVCLVARRSFEAMGELNPQVLKSLRIVALSRRVVPVVVGVRKGCSPQQKEALKTAMVGLTQSTQGKQILAVFGGTAMIATDTSALAASNELMQAAKAVRARRGAK
jgi:ABC-type phosphate/phosphonate transport system substrate-binding protein